MSLADGPPPLKPRARKPSRRARAARAPLSEDAVIDAALSILKSDGLDAVTMRRVATALDTGAASLYVYVDGREGLLQMMLDRVIATVKLEGPEPSRWRPELHSLLTRLHEALVGHPGIAELTVLDPPDAVLKLSENLQGILLAGGIDPQDAVRASDMLMALVKTTAAEDEEWLRFAIDVVIHGLLAR